MEASAVTKYLRISPPKARQVVRLIQGMQAQEALAYVRLLPRRAGEVVAKTLASAIANAEESPDGVNPSDLIVKTAVVEEGPTMKRFRAKARGMVGRVNKRTSHIRIVVTDE
jgi:large subunit ribosomal protein L22